MDFILAEKYPGNSYTDTPQCDLENPTVTYDEGTEDVQPATLLTAYAVMFTVLALIWLSANFIKWSFHRLLMSLPGYGRRLARHVSFMALL